MTPTRTAAAEARAAGSCRLCPVSCERVVMPAGCLESGCSRLYSYEQDGRTWIGCLEGVYRAEIDLHRFSCCSAPGPASAACAPAREPLPMCRTEIERTFEHRSDGPCVNPDFLLCGAPRRLPGHRDPRPGPPGGARRPGGTGGGGSEPPAEDRCAAALAALPLDEWRPTKETLHRWCQIVGKVRMALTPPLNHWWHVTLRVSARGVTTGPMPCDGRAGRDRVRPRRPPRSSCAPARGAQRDFALHDGLSVAAFHDRLFARSGRARRARARSVPTPFDLGDSPAFPDDSEHRSYDAEAVGRWWTVLRSTAERLRRVLRALLRARPARCSSSGTASTSP